MRQVTEHLGLDLGGITDEPSLIPNQVTNMVKIDAATATAQARADEAYEKAEEAAGGSITIMDAPQQSLIFDFSAISAYFTVSGRYGGKNSFIKVSDKVVIYDQIFQLHNTASVSTETLPGFLQIPLASDYSGDVQSINFQILPHFVAGPGTTTVDEAYKNIYAIFAKSSPGAAGKWYLKLTDTIPAGSMIWLRVSGILTLT